MGIDITPKEPFKHTFLVSILELGNKLYITPSDLSSSTGNGDRKATVNIICFGEITTFSTADTIDNFPEGFTDSACTYAAIKLIQAKMGEVKERFTSTITAAVDEIGMSSLDSYATQNAPALTVFQMPSVGVVSDVVLPDAQVGFKKDFKISAKRSKGSL